MTAHSGSSTMIGIAQKGMRWRRCAACTYGGGGGGGVGGAAGAGARGRAGPGPAAPGARRPPPGAEARGGHGRGGPGGHRRGLGGRGLARYGRVAGGSRCVAALATGEAESGPSLLRTAEQVLGDLGHESASWVTAAPLERVRDRRTNRRGTRLCV